MLIAMNVKFRSKYMSCTCAYVCAHSGDAYAVDGKLNIHRKHIHMPLAARQTIYITQHILTNTPHTTIDGAPVCKSNWLASCARIHGELMAI